MAFVFGAFRVGGEIDVVDPPVLRNLGGDGITADNLFDGKVAEDDVLDVLDVLDCQGEVGKD